MHLPTGQHRAWADNRNPQARQTYVEIIVCNTSMSQYSSHPNALHQSQAGGRRCRLLKVVGLAVQGCSTAKGTRRKCNRGRDQLSTNPATLSPFPQALQYVPFVSCAQWPRHLD